MMVAMGNARHVSEGDTSFDFSSLTVDELKSELSARSLPVGGNHDALVKRLEDDAAAPLRVTDIGPFSDDYTVDMALSEITDPTRGVWQGHSSEKPLWVWSDNEELQARLAGYYGCKQGYPANLEEMYWTNEGGPPGIGPDGPLEGSAAAEVIQAREALAEQEREAQRALATAEDVGNEEAADAARVDLRTIRKNLSELIIPLTFLTALPILLVAWFQMLFQLRTNAGADFQAAQMSGTPGAAANYMALSTNATAPVATDTVLTGELNTAGGGLIRALATYAHTAGTTTYTLSRTFTANATDGASNTVQKAGIFTAAAGGTMVFETAVPSPPVMVAGDQLTVTLTVNM